MYKSRILVDSRELISHMPKRSKDDTAEEKEEEEEEEEEDTSDDDGSDEYPDVSDELEDGDDDEDGNDTKQEEIVIDFEFFTPKVCHACMGKSASLLTFLFIVHCPQEIDFHGLKALLFTYLDGEQYDASGLVNAILKQVLNTT